MSTGTPYFVARQVPCEMCEDIPCVKACPTGALDHSLTDINKARMGLAVLVDQETCLNFLGLRCDVCYRVCPVIDKAITLDPQTQRAHRQAHAVHSGGAFGRLHRLRQVREGLPDSRSRRSRSSRSTWPRASCRQHYRLGWEEKEKAGGSLVAPDVEHQYNLPEGMRYEHGKGLSVVPAPVTAAAKAPSRQRRLAQGLAGRQAMSAASTQGRVPKRSPRRAGWLRTSGCSCAAPASSASCCCSWSGRWFGLWIVKGNLNYSYTLDVLPLTDPYVLLQSLVTRAHCRKSWR